MCSASLKVPAARLADRVSGSVLMPTDPRYQDARRVHNGLIDKHPAVIVRCHDASDVQAALAFAGEHELDVGIRSGGHNVAGRAVPEGGLMVDLSAMRQIDVNPGNHTARAGAGATWGMLNEATQAHGLAVTGGVISTTGIAGLTLGGGIGWLMAKHGLALDNLESVQIVTADGDIRMASAAEEPDLFWAVRGAGANFGVVTSLTYRLHPVGPTIFGGLIAYPIEAAAEVLRFVRDFNGALPDELTVYVVLTHAPDGSGLPVVAVALCHCGDLEAAERAVQPLRELGTPIMDAAGPMPYSALNSMLDASYPAGALNYWKSAFLEDLKDDAIETLVDCFARCPSVNSDILLEHVHGRATRIDAQETAFPHRREGYNLLVMGQWMDAGLTDRCIAWTRDTYSAMQPFVRPDRYINYLDDDESEDVGAAAYGLNSPRLRELKARYDPHNIFHLNHNIVPAPRG